MTLKMKAEVKFKVIIGCPPQNPTTFVFYWTSFYKVIKVGH